MSSTEIIEKSGTLKTNLEEPTKTYVEYDNHGRPISVTTGRHDLRKGELAFRTIYAYDADSSRVTFQLEYHIAWNSSWDLLPFPNDALDTGRV